MALKSAQPSWLDGFSNSLIELDHAHLRRTRRVVVPVQGGAYLRVIDQALHTDETLLAFCTNDYLGLSQHEALIAAACHTAQQVGVGAGASPLVSGHSLENQCLEEALAAFVGLPRALYFYAGYATNMGIVPALVGDGDAIFSDQLNHACLIDGARLSKARIHRYEHQNLAALEDALKHSDATRKLIISDAVFSMDGSLADIVGLYELCERYDALLLLDDAHGFGVLGDKGAGSLMQAGFVKTQFKRRILYMATLGKAAGVAGAFVAGDAVLIEWLMQTTRSYIFATAAPAMLASSVRASLQVMTEDTARLQHLRYLIDYFKQSMHSVLALNVSQDPYPWQLLPSNTPIQPLVVGSNAAALRVMQALWQRGIWVPAIRPPTVPAGTARLRITLSALHTTADIDRLIQALIWIKTNY
jgi:8-amino-7-oxononanoate synthase